MPAYLHRIGDEQITVHLDGLDADRAERILAAAVLAINDKAPELYAGLTAPANTNISDLANYS